MREDMLPLSGAILTGLGIVYQWVRQHSGVSEKWTTVYAVGLAGLAYLLCFDFTKHIDWQPAIGQALLWLIANTSTVLGGTFGASNLAKAGVPGIPMTNSK